MLQHTQNDQCVFETLKQEVTDQERTREEDPLVRGERTITMFLNESSQGTGRFRQIIY